MGAQLDPADPAFLADPHGVYDALRTAGQLVRDPLGWSTIGYAASDAAFRDTALVPGIDPLLEERGFGALWAVPGHTLTDSEGVDHRRLRTVVSPWFTAKRIAGLQAFTRELVAELLANADDGEPFDAMDGLADHVPARLFCATVGAGTADAAQLTEWSKALLLVFTATADMVAPVRAAKAELAVYTRDLLAHKAAHPGDDLATVLAEAAASGRISADDAVYLLDELLSASVDNTANTTGCALHALASHPDQWAIAHERPDTIDQVVEECGRFEPAIRHTIKYAVADSTLAGQTIKAGEYVTIRIAAAHRDPEAYERPHELDVGRSQPQTQLAFGAGRHYCLGAALGRMEVQEMVAALTSRWPAVEIAGFEGHIVESGHVARLQLQGASTR